MGTSFYLEPIDKAFRALHRHAMNSFHDAMYDYANLVVRPDRLRRQRLTEASPATRPVWNLIRDLHTMDENSVAFYGSNYFALAFANHLVRGRGIEPQLPSERWLRSSLMVARS